MKNKLWVEKFRPNKVEDYVFVDENQKKIVQQWILDKSIPHLLLSGDPGTGKTTLAKVLINELDVENFDVLEINASRENGIDNLREKINGFVQTMPFGKFKVVLLDECLHENTIVHVLRNGNFLGIPIKDLNPDTDLVKSYDMDTNSIEYLPFEKMDKGEQEIYEIELDNGETVSCTDSHKWYVADETGNTIVVRTDQLHLYNHILSPIN